MGGVGKTGRRKGVEEVSRYGKNGDSKHQEMSKDMERWSQHSSK